MRTFVMGDIHGAYRALLQCLDRSGFDYNNDTLVQLGDVADGFPQVYDCVEELLKIRNLIAIRGNHDDWFQRFLQTGIHPDIWTQGGLATAFSYQQAAGNEWTFAYAGRGYRTYLNPGDIPEAHHNFFLQQHVYYVDDSNNCFVHAGFNRKLSFYNQPSPDIYFWDRKLWLAALSFKASQRNNDFDGTFHMETPFKEIFIGHTNTLNWKTDQPMHAANIYNVDTGAGHTGRLTIMDIETKEYWQSDSVSELYPERIP
ncbi:metallophosphoesterase [Chitinophagaceae bacterium MMS25-I14]